MKLLNCPHCGGKAILNKDYLCNFYVSCDVCEIQTIGHLDPNISISAWNRRTQNIGKKERCEQDGRCTFDE